MSYILEMNVWYQRLMSPIQNLFQELLVRCVEQIVQNGNYTLNFYKSSPLYESQTETFYVLEYIDQLSNCATVTGTLNSVKVL